MDAEGDQPAALQDLDAPMERPSTADVGTTAAASDGSDDGSSAHQPAPAAAAAAEPDGPDCHADAGEASAAEVLEVAREGSTAAIEEPVLQEPSRQQQQPVAGRSATATPIGSPEAPQEQQQRDAPTPGALVDDAEPQAEDVFQQGVRGIDVEVDCGPGLPCRLVRVVIDVSAVAQKPFLGGYRHKGTGATLHHAHTQTARQQQQTGGQAGSSGSSSSSSSYQKLCRETQTVYTAATSCQTVREAATQMARPGLLLDDSHDRVLSPRPYFSARQLDEVKLSAALTIQRYTRGWLARARAAVLRRHKHAREGFLQEQAAEQAEAAETAKRQDLSRRLQPLTGSDFRLLTGELQTWQQQELSKIKAAGLSPQQEQTALQLLLAKETRLLQTIDKLRVGARAVAREKRADVALSGMAAPVTWDLRNGAKVEVHTPATVRAQELQQLYRGLNLTQLTVDERLDVLLHVKWTVKEFDCSLTRELVELIDREADLVNRGRKPSTLEGLRKRISNLFFSFCTTPAFNPEAARFQTRPAGAPTAAVAEVEDEAFEFMLDDVKGTGRAHATVAAC